MLVLALVQEAIKNYPALSADLKAFFSKENPTPEDWLGLKTRCLAATFESLAPDAKLS